MILVLVADDHSVVREGVKGILADTPDLLVAGEASNSREVRVQVTTRMWDVVLLDVYVPGKNRLEVLHDLKRIRPRLPVLVFSMHSGGQHAVRAFKAGAVGYLCKDCLPQELVAAIRRVAQGGRYASQSLAEQLVFEMTRESDEPLHTSLSDREYQVLWLFAFGKTLSEVADEMALSASAIKTYRVRILEKLHLRTTIELIHYAIHHQLVA